MRAFPFVSNGQITKSFPAIMKKLKRSTYLRYLSFIGVCTALLAAQLAARAQTLAHEYQFYNATNNGISAGGTVPDTGTPGGNAATLFGDAVVTGGQLELDGTAGTYVALQPGIVTNDLAVTVEAWGLFPPLGQQGGWANLFDFGSPGVVDGGRSDSYSISFCVNGLNPVGTMIAGISDFDDANVNRQNATCDESLIATDTAGTYLSVVFNPTNNTGPGALGYEAIYVNGVQEASVPITNNITPGIRDVSNLIGWDNWPDQTILAGISEFRVWNGALNGLQVAASYTSGQSTVSIVPGNILSITLTAPYQVVVGGQVPSTVVATAQNTGGISVDITKIATYSSLNPGIATVNATTGEIQAVAVGNATIQAAYGGMTSTWVIAVIESNPILSHRYSFHDTANTTGVTVADSVGVPTAINGVAMGGAEEEAVGPGGSQVLVVDGAVGSYLDLSSTNSSIITGDQSATVDFWGTFTAENNDWTYGYSFGQSYGYGVDFLYFAINANGTHYLNESTAAGGAGLSMGGIFANETVHCTTLIDPVSGVLAMYTNGILSGVLKGYTVPISAIETNYMYFGRSLWTTPGPDGAGDPYMTAGSSFNEIRIYNGALTPQQIAVADQNGPGNTNIDPGALQSVSISVPSTMELGSRAVPGLIGQYANLTNYNITQNSLTPLLIFASGNSNVLYQGSDGYLHTAGVGTATISVNSRGSLGSPSGPGGRPPPPVLVHEFTFHDAVGSTNAFDSVGGSNWSGALPNGGTFSGTNLTISTTGSQYVSLPPGVIQSNGIGSNYARLTIDVWVNASYDPVNSMLYAFGNTDTNGAGEDYIFGSLNRDYTAITAVDPGYGAEQGYTGSVAPLPTNQLIHFTGVYNPPSGYLALYTNGVLVGENSSVTDPLSVVSDAEAYIGHSLYTGDPYATLTLSEFRIYNGALLADQVKASDDLGPSVPLANPNSASLTATRSGSAVLVTWPEAETGFSVYTSSTLGAGAVWSLVSETPTLVGHTWQLSMPASAGQAFYRLNWAY